MPVSAGSARRSWVKGSSPPADAPTPTMGNGAAGCGGLVSSTKGGVAPLGFADWGDLLSLAFRLAIAFQWRVRRAPARRLKFPPIGARTQSPQARRLEGIHHVKRSAPFFPPRAGPDSTAGATSRFQSGSAAA